MCHLRRTLFGKVCSVMLSFFVCVHLYTVQVDSPLVKMEAAVPRTNSFVNFQILFKSFDSLVAKQISYCYYVRLFLLMLVLCSSDYVWLCVYFLCGRGGGGS